MRLDQRDPGAQVSGPGRRNEPSGAGDHVYFTIEKTGLTTHDAVRRIAEALGVAARAIGYAGLKDARGVTRQTLSLEHADPDRWRQVQNRTIDRPGRITHRPKRLEPLYFVSAGIDWKHLMPLFRMSEHRPVSIFCPVF